LAPGAVITRRDALHRFHDVLQRSNDQLPECTDEEDRGADDEKARCETDGAEKRGETGRDAVDGERHDVAPLRLLERSRRGLVVRAARVPKTRGRLLRRAELLENGIVECVGGLRTIAPA